MTSVAQHDNGSPGPIMGIPQSRFRPLDVPEDIVLPYIDLFVNSSRYASMTDFQQDPDSNTYYQAKRYRKPAVFGPGPLKMHLKGFSTHMLYTTNPDNHRCKWICVDADYPNAEADLDMMIAQLRIDGVTARFEYSRRGGHLWIFNEVPLLAAECRRYMYDVAKRLQLPVVGSGVTVGLEIYPKQDIVPPGRDSNGVRGPLGVHRKDYKRYWFRDAPETLRDQMAMLLGTPKLSQPQLDELLSRVPKPAPIVSEPRVVHSYKPFSIFDYFAPPPNGKRRYEVECPSCHHYHLTITVGGEWNGAYKCFNGCQVVDIRRALGCPKISQKIWTTYRRAA